MSGLQSDPERAGLAAGACPGQYVTAVPARQGSPPGADLGKIVKGRRATSVAAIRDDIVNAGVNWVDRAAVVDGNLISARTPADLGPCMKAPLPALDMPGS